MRTASALCALAAAALASPALATVTYSGSSGNLAAQASFDVTGSTLTVTLTNTSLFDVAVPADVLTGVFFSVAGPPLSLTPVSALLAPGTVVDHGSDGGGNVGGEWAYAGGIAGIHGTSYGISSSGLGIFGSANFNGTNLEGPTAVNGLQYGISSAGDNPNAGNAAVTGGNALIRNSVVFTLIGLPSGFSEGDIHNVWLQYGTATNEPQLQTPGPGSAAILGIASLLAGRRRRG